MTEHRSQGNARVDGLAFVFDGETPRLDFPHAHIERLSGTAGALAYGATELVMEQLTGLLRGVAWTMESASAGNFWLRDPAGRFEATIDRVELPHGLRITHAAGGGVELVAPHVSLSDVTVSIRDLSALRTSSPASTPAPPPAGLRQERMRFLDELTGQLGFRIAVVLDLPVIGHRTLNQSVQVALKNGAFDFKKLDQGLTWLEGQFLDIGIADGRFRIGWGIPLFGTKEIISWALDSDASTLATFDQIPLRALADFRIPTNAGDRDKPSRLKTLTLRDILIKLSLVAPQTLEFAGGTIRFGGDDAPGIVDLHVTGALVHPPAPGAVQAAASAVDVTFKDLDFGGIKTTADRVTIGPIDSLAVAFDGFTPTALTALIHRMTATNLSLTIGSSPPTSRP